MKLLHAYEVVFLWMVLSQNNWYAMISIFSFQLDSLLENSKLNATLEPDTSDGLSVTNPMTELGNFDNGGEKAVGSPGDAVVSSSPKDSDITPEIMHSEVADTSDKIDTVSLFEPN